MGVLTPVLRGRAPAPWFVLSGPPSVSRLSGRIRNVPMEIIDGDDAFARKDPTI